MWAARARPLQEAPELAPYSFDAGAYDLVILGTPLWAWNITPPLRAFLRQNDLSGVKTAAFVCCGGGNPDKAFAAIRAESHKQALAAQMTVVNALADPKTAAERIRAFCASLRG